MATIAEILSQTRVLLENYENANGLGTDAYFKPVAFHSMAEGKYIDSICYLHETNLISNAKFIKLLEKSTERLETAAIDFEKGKTFGLGFEWEVWNCSAQEPYLITTAIVLLALRKAFRQENSVRISQLIEKIEIALENWRIIHFTKDSKNQINILAYSPMINKPIVNSAAMASAAMLESVNSKPWKELLLWCYNQKCDKIGWSYSVENNTIDLVHNCYILEASKYIISHVQIETDLIEIIGNFSAFKDFIDKFEKVSEHTIGVKDNSIPIYRTIGEHKIRIAQPPARLWSLGALLETSSNCIENSKNPTNWRTFCLQLASLIITRGLNEINPESNYPRHTMHAAAGMAAIINMARQHRIE